MTFCVVLSTKQSYEYKFKLGVFYAFIPFNVLQIDESGECRSD